MNPTSERSRNEDNRAMGEALADQFLRKYRRPKPPRPHLLYCGHLGSRANLEVHLWKHVECRLTEEEERGLLDHADNCGYCQFRIRDLAKVLREALPEPAPALEPAGVILRLRRVTTTVKDAGRGFWAEVLVAAENTGKWLAGNVGAGLILRRLPAVRGLGAGTTRGLEPHAQRNESSIRSIVPALTTSLSIEGMTLFCEIRSEGSRLLLRIGSADGTGADLESLLAVTCRIDGGPEKPIQLGPQGMEITVPHSSRQIEFEVARGSTALGRLVVTLE